MRIDHGRRKKARAEKDQIYLKLSEEKKKEFTDLRSNSENEALSQMMLNANDLGPKCLKKDGELIQRIDPVYLNPTNEWTFSIIDSLFEAIKGKVSGTQQTYDAWGHSGGAQFIHRFRMFMPDSKLNLAICSNAGWYTVPDILLNFPYGIKKSPLSNSSLTIPFSKKLIVHLGLNDTDENSAGLRHNTTVDTQQGLYRLVRGRYFFTKSQTIAQTVNFPFNWQKYEVAGVGHDAQLMANDALKYLIESYLSLNEGFEEQCGTHFSAQAYPNPSNTDFTLKVSNTNFCFKVYDLQGKLMEQHQMIPTQSTTIGANYPAGIYPIMVTQDKQIKVLKLIKK